MLSLREQGVRVVAILRQYDIASSTFYYWLSRYEAYETYSNLSRAPKPTEPKVTQEIKAEVIETHKANPKLGCWRLSLFEYGGNRLSRTTIWLILKEAKPPKKEKQVLYVITHFHQIWFMDHMHMRTLVSGEKVYSLIIVDGMSRVLFSSEVIRSKSARDAVKVLIRAFARWGMPDEIVSDNAKAFESLLYTLLLSTLEIKIRHTTPGCPWENGHAESLIGTLRDYLYPHLQRQKTVDGVARVYQDKVDYYNNRDHFEFQNDDVKKPLGKLGGIKGREMPADFSLEIIETTKPSSRTISSQGWISVRRYRLYVSAQLAKEKVEIREFVTNWVISYASNAVVTYKYCEQTQEMSGLGIDPSPLFHDNRHIPQSPQFELFKLDTKSLRFVKRRPPNQKRKRLKIDAIPLVFDFSSP